MDISEDDPRLSEVLSPSQSTSTASAVASPSRQGKGKAKAVASVQMSSMNYLKSISELRNKGEGRRFLDEAGYLFEGLDATGGIGLRRATYGFFDLSCVLYAHCCYRILEIITKLCDSEFNRKAQATDFYARTWDLLRDAGVREGQDKVS